MGSGPVPANGVFPAGRKSEAAALGNHPTLQQLSPAEFEL